MVEPRQLREYQLVKLMLRDREGFYAEFARAMRLKVDGALLTDRAIIQAILESEFPAVEPILPQQLPITPILPVR